LADNSHASSRRRELTVDDYCAGVQRRDIALLARALTLVESNNPQHQALADEMLTRLLPHAGNSIRVGVTGAPGVGKSTFIESLGMHLIRAGKKIAVLAVDPSSGISGGSILGDKTRMPTLAIEPAAYIRPSPSAGTLGGVAHKTRESILVCEAAGHDVVLIETVGVGQSETMVADMTDCFLALMLSGAGDELQGIKRGLLELVDVIAVNKADGANCIAAQIAARQYRTAFESLTGRDRANSPVVLTCSALEHENIDAVWDAIEQLHARRTANGEVQERRKRQNLHWLWAAVDDQLRQLLERHPKAQAMRAELERDVLDGKVPPEVAAKRILDAFD
jgi:LAO/AO transport system kinase